MNFWKTHGLGNDFILIDLQTTENQKLSYEKFASLARQLCTRRFQIGGDGVLFVAKGNRTHYRMYIFNADGSEAEMCGNALRCMGKYLYEIKAYHRNEMVVETKAGIKELSLNTAHGVVNSVEVNMGTPSFSAKAMPVNRDTGEIINQNLQVEHQQVAFTGVSMGNPHAVIFQSELNNQIITELGPKIEKHPFFPYGTNVEFVKINDRQNLQVEVWERGVGRTYACGTGACASLAAALKLGFVDSSANVRLPGGNLNITWDQTTGEILMSGKARLVFQGYINIAPE